MGKRHRQTQCEALRIEMLANLSHELRSPLASITGPVETLLRLDPHFSRAERREFLLIIKQASDRLCVVIDRLLELAALDAGTLILERSLIDLPGLAREALTAAQQRHGVLETQNALAAEMQPVIFSLQTPDEASTTEEMLIQADRSRLREVLDHLLDNAIAYSPAGGTIAVAVRPMMRQDLIATEKVPRWALRRYDTKKRSSAFVQRGQHGVELCVRDEGIGIPVEHLEQIFERFCCLDTALTRTVYGLGVGLTLCQRLVELHEGIIWTESIVGAGSAFYVWLPIDAEG